MAGVNETNETFTCPVDSYCLGVCSWTGCPGNADMAKSGPHPECEASLIPSINAGTTLNTNELHPSFAVTKR